MDRLAYIRRALVVSDSVLISEDLADILREFAGAVVDAKGSLDEAWDRRYDVAVFDAPLERLLGDERIAKLRKLGTRMIILERGGPGLAEENAGIAVLAQPFRTSDVVALLERMGLARRR